MFNDKKPSKYLICKNYEEALNIAKKRHSKDDIEEYHCRQVREIIKDVYGGIEYERRSESDPVTDNRADNRGSCT